MLCRLRFAEELDRGWTGIMKDQATTERKLGADILSPGVLAGTLHFFVPSTGPPERGDARTGEAGAEIERFEKQAAVVVAELEKIITSLMDDSMFAEAEIAKTHLYLLKDTEVHREVHAEIRQNALNAEQAAEKVLHGMMATLEQSGTWLSERTADIHDILNRLQTKLSEQQSQFFDSLDDVCDPVVVTAELSPSLVLEARRLKRCAFIVEKGTSTSHAAILAKSFGFPAVRVESLKPLEAESGGDVLVDAANGYVTVHPNAQEVRDTIPERAAVSTGRPVSPLVHLWINIIDPRQVQPEVLRRVEGIGLYRTEVLFMESKDHFPSEDEQYEVYRRLFEACGEAPVVFRTADIGGDKMLPYFSLGPQENPYLGLRAHRIYRFHPEILVTQIRALLRAAQEQTQVRILYPMIEDIEDLRFVQNLLTRATESLRQDGLDFKAEFQQGIMVEVPSAAWNLDELLQRMDFASVGTNDLLQYFLAVDRNNSNVGGSYRTRSPAFLKVLRSLVETADRCGKSLSLCGEIASDRSLLPLLIGIGFKDFSVDVHMLDLVEDLLSTVKPTECEELADACLHCRTSEEVRVMLREFGYEQAPAPSAPSVIGEEAIDPVCGMLVHADQSSYTYTRAGTRYYFCSVRCRDEFVQGNGG